MNTPIASKSAISPSDNIDILLEDVAVLYRVPREQISGIKEFTIRWLQRKIGYQEFWALQDINLMIRKGEVFGVIGLNGSGKSTLLKVIARVLTPTRGRIYIRGRVAPLLELGGGFHPELTGRENVYLNSALLGRSRPETDRLFAEIVEFAEIADFIDAPLRTYSTGMVARLGFAVATCVRPEILLVDEVLSVGDAPFQQKCLDRMESFRKQGTTIVIVTHSMGTIETFCDRAMWLDHGRAQASGAVSQVIQSYINLGKPTLSEAQPAWLDKVAGESPADPAQVARNILDFTPLDEHGRIYPTAGIFTPEQGAVSSWVRFHSDRPHRNAIIFHTDDSRYVLYIGSHACPENGQDVPVLIARAGGNRRVMDTFYGSAGFPEAATLVDRGNLGGVKFPVDEWHLLTMTWSGYPEGTVRLYLDERLVGQKGYDSRYDNGQHLASSLVVGMRPVAWTGELIEKEDGTLLESPVTDTMAVADSEVEIQQVRLYRKALGPEEIRALCALGRHS